MRGRLAALAVVAATAFAACVASLHYSTTEQHQVTVSPNPHDFGAVKVGMASGSAKLTISPAGSGASDDQITSITIPGCSGFSITAALGSNTRVSRQCAIGSDPMEEQQQTFTAGGDAACPSPVITTFDFFATFAPVVTGTVTCNGIIGIGSGSSQTFQLKGVGIPPDFAIDIRPIDKTINFGDVRRGSTSITREISLTNVGGMMLAVDAITLVDPMNAYTLTARTAPYALAVGQTETLSLSCTPPAFDTFPATLTIKNQDPEAGNTMLSLACQGIDSPLDVIPSQIVLDPMNLGDLAQKKTLTLVNRDLPGTLNSVDLAPGSDPSLAISMKPAMNLPMQTDGSATIEVTYNPSAVANGDIGSLAVKFDGNEQLITISADARIAKVASEPNAIDFGSVCPGQPVSAEVLVYSEADGEFTVGGAAADPPFSVTPPMLSPATVMQPVRGNEQPFTITIDAAPGVEGLVEDDVNILTSAPMQRGFPIHVIANALPTGVAARPETLPLGSTKINTITSSRVVRFTNCNTETIEITGETIAGADAEHFFLTRGFERTMVAPAETVEIDIQLAPRSEGQKRAQLVIAHTGGADVIVELAGEGDRERGTYYACDAGGTVGFGAIGGALVLLLRRRRSHR